MWAADTNLVLWAELLAGGAAGMLILVKALPIAEGNDSA